MFRDINPIVPIARKVAMTPPSVAHSHIHVEPDPLSPGMKGMAFAQIILIGALLVLSGCTSEPTKPAEETKPEVKTPELLTGRSAFQKMYVAARGWARDPQPYRIQSVVTSDGNGHDGKAALWRASFASPSQHAVKSYTWSGSTAPDAPSRGINPGGEDNYSPTNSSTQIFDVAFLKVDSDQAFATAQKHGGDKILEKSPDTPVTYVCDWNHNTNELIWHVIYGTGRDSSKLTVAVNASSGDFIRVEK
jgi:hypothetical protein